MTPEELEMIKDELHMTREQLLMVILDLRKKAAEDDAARIENSQAILVMSRDYRKLQEEADALRAENKELKEALLHVSQVSQLQTNELFGRGTEKLADILDAPLMVAETDETDQEPEEDDKGVGNDATASKHASEKRRNHKSENQPSHKRNGKREEDLSRLPQKELFRLDIAALDEEYGEGNWRIAFWHRHTTLEEIPSSIYALNIYTPVISVGLEHCLTTVPYDAPLWQRSMASPSIVAKVLYQKYFLSLPLYRQEMLFDDLDVSLSRQTLSNWVLRSAFMYFWPVYEHLARKLLKVPYHQCDETPMIVNHDQRKPGAKSYMWVHTTSELADTEPVILFCFELTRSTEHLRKFYKDFEGYISCDAYCSYKTLEKEKLGAVIICGCLMHLRRRMVESLSLIDLSSLDEDAIASLPETQALILIGKIYDADEKLKTLTADERQSHRDTEVRPLMDEYFQYIESLDTDDPSMSERLKDAINYSKNQKGYLYQFLDDGHIPCDNGFVEREIRAYSSLRRNMLFCDSIDGAKATAIMYSIVETARRNGANIYWYLRYVLEKMPHDEENPGEEFLETMMPWSEEYREYEKRQRSEGPPELMENEYRERPKISGKRRCTNNESPPAQSA